MLQAITRWVIKPEWTTRPAAVAQGLVLFGEVGANGWIVGGGNPTPNGGCRAIRLSDGSDVWRRPVEGIVTSPVRAEGGIAYFVATFMNAAQKTYKSLAYAVDVATGSVRWTAPADGWANDFLILMEGIVLFPTPGDAALLIDKQTGTFKKRLDLRPGAMVGGIWNEQIAIVYLFGPWIDILDPKTSTTTRLYTHPQPIWEVSFFGDRCYVAASSDQFGPSVITSVNLGTGTREWSRPYEHRVSVLRAQGQALFVTTAPSGDSATISLLETTSGNTKWAVPTAPIAPFIGPVVANQVLGQIKTSPYPEMTVVTTGWDISTGAESFRFEFPHYFGWIVDADENVVLSSHHNHLFAFDIT